MSKYFNDVPLIVSDGNDAQAADLNNFIAETDAAFDEVEQDINETSDLAFKYAEEDNFVQVTPGTYSSKHYSNISQQWAIGIPVDNTGTPTGDQSAKDEAIDAAASASAASASASSASGFSSAASASASAASGSASAASTSASNALASETAAGISETNAAASETAAGVSETNATASAAAALVSEGNASASEVASAASALSASTSESNASASETAAGLSQIASAASAAAALISEGNASASEIASAASALSASTSESNAAASETAAGISETNALASETAAGISETNASNSASAASTSASNALTSENNAAASYDSFDDRYLGSKAVAPTLDNDGDALLEGALYWNSVSNAMFIYDGSAWNEIIPNTSSSLITFTQSGTGAVERTANSKFIDTVSVKDFGAVGDGVTNDSSAIQAAITAANNVYIPPGNYLAEGIATTSAVNIYGSGTLILPIDSTSDYILTISHDNTNIFGISLDGNKGNHTTYTARGELLVVSASYCNIENVKSSNSPNSGTSACFVANSGGYNKFKKCYSNNSGRTAYRVTTSDHNIFDSIVGLNWDNKGFLIDGSSTGTRLTNSYFTSNTTETSVECILVDPGPSGLAEDFVISNTTCEGPDGVTLANNCIKFAYITDVTMENCKFLHTSDDLTTMRIQQDVGRIHAKNCVFSRDLNFDGEGEVVILEGCIIGNGTTTPNINRVVNECKARLLTIRDTRFYNYLASAIRLDAGSTFNPRVIIDNVELEAYSTSTTATMFSIGYTPVPGEIKVAGYNVIVGSSNGTTNLCGASVTDSYMQRGGLKEFSREFRYSAAPSTNTWKRGDIVWNNAPAASGNVGWVCVTAGTPGTWKSFGTISA